MPKIWVKNPEKWQKLGKINPENPEFHRNYLLHTQLTSVVTLLGVLLEE